MHFKNSYKLKLALIWVSRFCMLLHVTAGHCRIFQKCGISCKNGSRFCILLQVTAGYCKNMGYHAKTGPAFACYWNTYPAKTGRVIAGY